MDPLASWLDLSASAGGMNNFLDCLGGSWEERHLKEGPLRRAAHPHCAGAWASGDSQPVAGWEASTPGEGPSAAAVFPSGKVTEPGPVYSAAQGLSE